ncbi:glycosyltransferase family 4 protein [Glycomyces salinus]|uniref:glycosyltransferase family 4 protein n=1 Tax=Glycomyces salinus TaxID=980294 RepID=UPI0018EB3AE8|nr:glycosyltransferase family 1 protein [Glycomyces salinus]
MPESPASPPDPTAPPLRVLVVTESFLPQINGVTNSVCRVLEHLAARGHTAAVVAPTGPDAYAGAPVHRVGGIELPGYEGFTVGLATRRRLRRTMQKFRPDFVHVASPFVLGHAAIRASRALGVRTVSVYQTDVAGFARRYRLKAAGSLIEHRLRRIHGLSDLTLAPSTASLDQLGRLGVPRVRFWPRGIDTGRFAPEWRSEPLRTRLLGAAAGPDATDDVLVGYVGRLAKEKDLHHLRSVQDVPGVRLVLVGEGPEEEHLREALPGALFTGPKYGDELAGLVASLDVFVHSGSDETFCQSVQEALASGVPAVGPASGGLMDRIDDGVNGFLYGCGDLAGLRSAVGRLAGDPELRRSMGRAARAGTEGRGWESVNDRLIEHYLSLVPHRAGTGAAAGSVAGAVHGLAV